MVIDNSKEIQYTHTESQNGDYMRSPVLSHRKSQKYESPHQKNKPIPLTMAYMEMIMTKLQKNSPERKDKQQEQPLPQVQQIAKKEEYLISKRKKSE